MMAGSSALMPALNMLTITPLHSSMPEASPEAVDGKAEISLLREANISVAQRLIPISMNLRLCRAVSNFIAISSRSAALTHQQYRLAPTKRVQRNFVVCLRLKD